MKNDEDVRNVVCMLMGLAYFPAGSVLAAYQWIRLNVTPDCGATCRKLLDYFLKQWVRSVGGNGFSVFRLKFRTNNALESYHHTLRSIVRTKPTVWNFLRKCNDFCN